MIDPPRYQRIKEQPQYSLQQIPNAGFFEIFLEIIERDKRLLDYKTNLKIWVYGNWSKARDRPMAEMKLENVESSGNTLVNSPVNPSILRGI